VRASRLVSLMLLLQVRGRLTATELAAELEVSVRTVYRDVEALQEAGVPVVGQGGPAGGYELLAGYRSRLTGLTVGEAEALFLAGLPGPAAELGRGAQAEGVRLKLQAALPERLRERAEHVRSRFLLDDLPWYRTAAAAPQLPEVAAALWAQRRIRMRYRRWRHPEEVRRVVDPYGLVVKAGTWYLVAATPGGPARTYRIDQIVAATALDEPAGRPESFQLAEYWRAHLADLTAALHTGTATIRVTEPGWRRLAVVLPAAVSLVDPPPRPVDGWTTLTLPIESIDHAHDALLGLGAQVEVLEPVELRARMHATAVELQRLHALSPAR
jgi:predicted DNA-binding transcriptional regulator YafY